MYCRNSSPETARTPPRKVTKPVSNLEESPNQVKTPTHAPSVRLATKAAKIRSRKIDTLGSGRVSIYRYRSPKYFSRYPLIFSDKLLGLARSSSTSGMIAVSASARSLLLQFVPILDL